MANVTEPVTPAEEPVAVAPVAATPAAPAPNALTVLKDDRSGVTFLLLGFVLVAFLIFSMGLSAGFKLANSDDGKGFHKHGYHGGYNQPYYGPYYNQPYVDPYYGYGYDTPSY